MAKNTYNKISSSWLAQIGGISLGQEKLCIQMGAMAGFGFGEKTLKNKTIHMIGVAAAGITAAIGAPIAGILLVFKKMKTLITLKSFFLVFFAVAGPQLILQLGVFLYQAYILEH